MKSIFRVIYGSLIAPIIDTILPPTCPVCDEPLKHGQRDFCTKCIGEIPLTRHWEKYDNELKVRAQESAEGVVSAAALFFYRTDSGWRRLIHKIKYKDQWRLGLMMGRWFGRELRKADAIASIDIVVAIPLHPLRMWRRGYNQADYIARGIAEELDIPHIVGGVERTRSNTSQVHLQQHERFRNVENLFAVNDPSLFEGRDILLVDDVYTTGSTMLSCAEAILKAAPNCKIHIAPLAISAKHFGNE